jgi:hypothetical protein
MAVHYTGVMLGVPRLTVEQTAAILATEWLLDPTGIRGAGRSTALAIATIRVAAEHPSQAIPIRDHHARGVDSLVWTIRELVEADTLLSRVYTLSAARSPELVINLRTAIHEWMPRGWEMQRRSARAVPIPPERSLDPRSRVPRMVLRLTDQQLSEMVTDIDTAVVPNDSVDALMYALQTEQTVLNSRMIEQARRIATEPKERSLWDHLEADDS